MGIVLAIGIAFAVLYVLQSRKKRKTYGGTANYQEDSSGEGCDNYTKTTAGDGDAYDQVYVVGEDFRLKWDMEIEYKDRDGKRTTRQITLKRFRVDRSGKEAELYGYCYLRNGGRTFYASRIERCVDLDTGEVVQDFIPYLQSKYQQSSDGQIDILWKENGDEIRVLLYVSRLDGMMKKAERDIIAEYIKEKRPDLAIADENLIAFIKNEDKVSKAMNGRLLTAIALKPTQHKRELLAYAEKLLSTKKKLNMEEEKIIAHMKKRLHIQ